MRLFPRKYYAKTTTAESGRFSAPGVDSGAMWRAPRAAPKSPLEHLLLPARTFARQRRVTTTRPLACRRPSAR